METKTQWRVGDAGLSVFGPPNGKQRPEIIANCLRLPHADRIVLCVNAHDDLVAALEGCEYYLTMICEVICKDNPPPGGISILDQTRAALAKARGE